MFQHHVVHVSDGLLDVCYFNPVKGKPSMRNVSLHCQRRGMECIGGYIRDDQKISQQGLGDISRAEGYLGMGGNYNQIHSDSNQSSIRPFFLFYIGIDM